MQPGERCPCIDQVVVMTYASLPALADPQGEYRLLLLLLLLLREEKEEKTAKEEEQSSSSRDRCSAVTVYVPPSPVSTPSPTAISCRAAVI